MEIHLNQGFGDHRLAVEYAWPESPVRYRVHGLFIQAQPQALPNTDIAHLAAGVHLDCEYNNALMFCFAGLFGEFGFNFIQKLRRSDPAPAFDA